MKINIINFEYQITQTLVFKVLKKPIDNYKKYFGGNLSDIFSSEEIENVTLPLFNDDDLHDLKEKVFIATGILPCEQFLFSLESLDNIGDQEIISLAHSIIIDSKEYIFNFKAPDKIGPIPIYKNIYNNNESLHITDSESIKIEHIKNNIICILNLNSLLPYLTMQSDLDLIFWSLIQFFPYFDKDSFKDYIKKNYTRYPYLFLNKYQTLTKFTSEISELQKIYDFTKNNIELFNIKNSQKNNYIFNINTIKILLQQRGKPDLENLFILISTSQETPIIIFKNKHIMYSKIYADTYFNNLDISQKQTVLIIITNKGITYEIMPDGIIYVTFKGPIDSFSEINKLILTYSKLFNTLISNLPLSLFAKAKPLIYNKIINITCLLSYVIPFDMSGFNNFKNKIESSSLIRVLESANTKYTWSKGIKNIFTESQNQFNYMQLGNFNRLPFNNFEITNRFSRIDIIIKNISEEDFYSLFEFLLYHLRNIDPVKNILITNNLKLLRILDPVNYSVNKKESIYSRLCQKPMQPKPVLDTEVAKLPKDRVINFWNYTKNENMHFYCPNNNYPYPGFIVGHNPDGNCQVCCRKKKENDSKVFKTCMQTHKYISEESSAPISYIITFNKIIDINRLSTLPEFINKFLIYNLEGFNIITESETMPVFKFDGNVYSIERIKKYTHASKIQNIDTNVLAEFLKEPIWKTKRKNKPKIIPQDVLNNPDKNFKYKKHYKKIIQAPNNIVYLYQNNKYLVLIEGIYQIANAHRLNQAEIRCKIITSKQLKRSLIGKYKTNEISFISEAPIIKKGGFYIEKEPFYYLLGVLTHTEDKQNISYLSCIAIAMQLTFNKLINMVISKLQTYDYIDIYNTQDLISELKKGIYDYKKLYIVLPILLEYTCITLELLKENNINIITSKRTIFNINDKFVLMFKIDNLYYPIVIAIPYSYSKNLQLEASIYDYDSPIIKMLLELTKSKTQVQNFSFDNILKLTPIKNILNYQGSVYAVEIESNGKLIYIGIDSYKNININNIITIGKYDLEESLRFIVNYAAKYNIFLFVDKLIIYGKTLVAYRFNNLLNFVNCDMPDLSIFKQYGFTNDLILEYLNYDPEIIMNSKIVIPEQTDFYNRYKELEKKRNDYIFYKEKKLTEFFNDTDINININNIKKQLSNSEFDLAIAEELNNPLKVELFNRGIYNIKKLYIYKHEKEQIYITIL